tara:strand:- start:661 stop:876 length:216 start_codon:yes stop_codon:yes gene_type:complete
VGFSGANTTKVTIMKDTALVRELKTYSKSELINEIVLLNDEVNGIWKTKERYKKMLKDSGVWNNKGNTNTT